MKIFGKAVAVALGALMVGSAMSGCTQATVFGNYLQDLSWSYKDDTSTMTIGDYIYYNYSAYYTASNKVENGTGDFLDQKLKDDDGKEMTAREFIAQTSDEACKHFLYVNKTFKDMKLKLTSDEIASYKANADQNWTYGRKTFEAYGISKDSFIEAGYENPAKLEAIFKGLYQEGGKKEVSLDELKKYYESEYVNYNYISIPLYETTTDDEGKSSSEKKSSDEVKKIKANLDKYVKAINDGTSYADEVKVYMKDYETETDPTVSATSILKNAGLGEEIEKAFSEMKDGNAKYITVGEDGDSPMAYLLYRGNIKDESKKLGSDESLRYSTLVNMKSEEFQKDVKAAVKNYKCEINKEAVEKYPSTMFITEPPTEAATSDEISADAEVQS